MVFILDSTTWSNQFHSNCWLNMKMKDILPFLLFVSGQVLALQTTVPCKKEIVSGTEFGYVCRCTENHCDTLDVPEVGLDQEYISVFTSKSGDRFNYEKGKIRRHSNIFDLIHPHLSIDQSKIHKREIIGFGGAFTGAVSHVLERLPEPLRNCFFQSYYSKEVGMGYSLMRLIIGGSDFDTKRWVYNLYPQFDFFLTNFNQLDPRDKIRNFQIKKLMLRTNNFDIKILAAAAYAPPWMRLEYGWSGKPYNQINPIYFQTWAEYHAKWLTLMKKDGLHIWGLATGNQPVYNSFKSAPCLSWNASDHSRFIVDFLKPTLARSGHTDLTIHGVDDMTIFAMGWLNLLQANNRKSVDFLDYVDLHKYVDFLADVGKTLVDIERKFNKPVIASEMCYGPLEPSKPVILGSWNRAEDLTKILFENFKYGNVGYIDWNLMLNSSGGPTFDKPVDAGILASPDFKSFVKQPTFYILAHFSKFIPVGSRQIEATFLFPKRLSLDAMAFLRPDQTISIFIHSFGGSKVDKLVISDKLSNIIEIEVKPKTLYTLIYKQFG